MLIAQRFRNVGPAANMGPAATLVSRRVMGFLHPCTRSDLLRFNLGLGPSLTFRRAFRFAGLRFTGFLEISPLRLGLHLFALSLCTKHGLEIKSLRGLGRTGTLIEIGLRLRNELRVSLKHILRSSRDLGSLVRSDLLIALPDKILNHFLSHPQCLGLHRTIDFDRTASAFKLDLALQEILNIGPSLFAHRIFGLLGVYAFELGDAGEKL